MADHLILYTRAECELCEQPIAMAAELGLPLDPVDISSDIELLRRYRNRIPVVQNPETREELGWPFDIEQLQALAVSP